MRRKPGRGSAPAGSRSFACARLARRSDYRLGADGREATALPARLPLAEASEWKDLVFAVPSPCGCAFDTQRAGRDAPLSTVCRFVSGDLAILNRRGLGDLTDGE